MKHRLLHKNLLRHQSNFQTLNSKISFISNPKNCKISQQRKYQKNVKKNKQISAETAKTSVSYSRLITLHLHGKNSSFGRVILGEEEYSIRRNQLSAANMLCFSATFDIFQFLNCSDFGNVAYYHARFF